MATTPEINGLLLKTNGEAQAVSYPRAEFLAGLYRDIECRTVTTVQVNGALTIWADDEGLFVENPEINRVASELSGSPIVGNIVFTGGVDAEGDTLSLHKQIAERLLTLLGLSNSIVLIQNKDS